MRRERISCLVIIGSFFAPLPSSNSADVTRESADAFRTNVIAKKDTGSNPPITYIDGTTFIYVRNSDHYIVAVTKKNASPGTLFPSPSRLGLIFHFLFHLVKMFKSYFGTDYKAVLARLPS